MSVQGHLRGQCWSQMLADNVQTSPGSAPGLSHTPSPVPVPSDDVMKLPREDMTTFGRCPSWDNFVLVTCDKCDTNVKIEAFESHVTLRHGSKSERSAYHRVLAARAAASLQSCEVKLTPCSTATHSSNSSVEGGTVGRPGGLTPVAGDSELPSSSCTSPLPPITRSPSPMATSEHDNESRDTPMDIDQLASEQQPASQSVTRKYVGEEADSTTNNVISIPDTHDMATMGIISEGQSLLDSMDSKFNFSVNPSTTADSTSISISTSNTASETFNTATTPHPPTHYITVSPLSKPSPSKKMTVGRVQQNVPPMEKKSSRDREYDPNKHCGVADPETKKPCTRSLTCKSHSVYLKRKVQNRSGVFDELLANHKAEKEAAAAKLAANSNNVSHDDSLGGSILERRLKQVSGSGPLSLASLSPSRVGTVTSINVPSPSYVKTSEDTLHYTTGDKID